MPLSSFHLALWQHTAARKAGKMNSHTIVVEMVDENTCINNSYRG